MSERFRIRLFVQEFDLRPGRTTIGRDPSCNITIDDPSISREHAQIVVEDECVRLRDLQSRNGVRVNGHRVDGEIDLHAGDKIHLGQQDLVFLREDSASRRLVPTSRMGRCLHCGVLYAVDETTVCPLCANASNRNGATSVSEAMHPTPLQPPDRTGWWMHLHAELADKAVRSSRLTEAEQVLQRVEEATVSAILGGERYDRASLEPVLAVAIRLARAEHRPRWLTWTLEMLRAFRVVPSGALLADVESLPHDLLQDARVALAAYVAELRSVAPALDGLAALATDLSSDGRLRAAAKVEPVEQSRAS